MPTKEYHPCLPWKAFRFFNPITILHHSCQRRHIKASPWQLQWVQREAKCEGVGAGVSEYEINKLMQGCIIGEGFMGYDIPKISLFNNENFIIQFYSQVLLWVSCNSLGRSFILTEVLNYSISTQNREKLHPILLVQGNETHRILG